MDGRRLVGPVLWSAWAAVVGVGLAGPGALWLRLASIAVASAVLYGAGRLARRASPALGVLPEIDGAGPGPAGGSPALSPRSPETLSIESRLRIALGSRSYFERVLAPYLGSLITGHPLADLDLWPIRRSSPRAMEARSAYLEMIRAAGLSEVAPRRISALGRLSGPKPPAMSELEDLAEKVEQAYERNRRRGSFPKDH